MNAHKPRIWVIYILSSGLIIYLTFAISFEVIDLLASLFFPKMIKINIGSTGWWPRGFWRILSGSSPYSIALLISTIIFLIKQGKTSQKLKRTNLDDKATVPEDKVLTIQNGKTIHRLNKQEILYIEGLREYVNWYTKDQKVITLHSLHKIETMLKNDGFIRIHKSYIVNTALVNTIKYSSLEIQNKQIPIGRSYRGKVSDYFQSDI